MRLLSPITRAPLTTISEHLLRDVDGQLWPVLDGIPYLRVGREALIEEIVERLRLDDAEGALVAALADQDDWWTGARSDDVALRLLVRERETLSLRAAMDLLAFDRVGNYFAHRWSDPTFLSGLALLETHWQHTSSAIELACGIGHFGRELAKRGVAYIGGDVVFAKLWLARHWVLPAETSLVCFDAAASWPISDCRTDLAFCHDAFYFLEPKREIVQALRALASPKGRVVVGHIHNSEAATLSSGHAVSAEEIVALFPDATVYDDAELTRALAEGRAPRAASPHALRCVDAFSLEDCARTSARDLVDGMTIPIASSPLRLNPLYQRAGSDHTISWPTPRYEAEYAGLATYPATLTAADAARLMQAPTADDRRRRIVVDLPDRW